MSSTDNRKFSIIINNYNYEAFLGQAIDSALAQTYPNVEVVVVDDGSKDKSVDIIRSYGDRIVPVIKQNGGQASAINAGFEASSGDVILLLDADDYFFPNAVETIAAAWRDDVAQAQSRLNLVDGDENYLDLHPAPEIKFDSGDVTSLLLVKGRYNTTVTSGVCFGRDVLDAIMPIPEEEFRISADGYLVATAPFYGNILSNETPIGARRKHNNNSWSFSSAALKIQQFRKSFEHDFLRYKYLRKTAEAQGYDVKAELGLADYLHVQDRLAYLRLSPDDYPIYSDSRYALSLKGAGAILKHTSFPWKRKIVLCFWFLWLGFAPAALAKTSVKWRFIGQSRPASVDAFLKRIRYSTK